MKVTIDLRSSQSGVWSGVETYIHRTLEHLLKLDRENHYTLFYNTFKKQVTLEHLRYINVREVKKSVPNRLLNLNLRLFGKPLFESYVGAMDVLWLPNFGHSALGKNTKLALTIHDLSPLVMPEMYNAKRRLWHKSIQWKKLAQRADVIFAVSEYTKQDTVRLLGVNPQKIVVTPLGVDHRYFSPNIEVDTLRRVRNKYQLPGQFVLFLGTLEPRKNLLTLLEAFTQMREECFLVLAGRLGWKSGELEKQLDRSSKKGRILRLGHVQETDKPAIYKLAKLLAFPSYYEGFGLPVLEAMAVGTPVVTSNVTSLPEVVGTAGLMVSPDRSDELAFAMDQILHNQSLAQKLSEDGLQRAANFSWEITAQRTLEALNSLRP